MRQGVKVRLKVDLTRYLSGLVAGTEGVTAGNWGEWSRNSDRFTMVKFPGIGTLDVVIDSLEIIDEEYLKEMEDYKNTRLEALKQATDIVLGVGPRGGFKYLAYVVPSSTNLSGVQHHSTAFRDEAEELIEHFTRLGLPIKQKVI